MGTLGRIIAQAARRGFRSEALRITLTVCGLASALSTCAEPAFPGERCWINYLERCDENPDLVIEAEVAVRQDGQAKLIRVLSVRPPAQQSLAPKATAALIKNVSHPRETPWVGVAKYAYCEHVPVTIEALGAEGDCPSEDELRHRAFVRGYRVLEVKRDSH